MHVLSKRASGAITGVSDEEAGHLRFWPDYLATAKPRRVGMKVDKGHEPVLVFVAVRRKLKE